jgi:hypothetical protein
VGRRPGGAAAARAAKPRGEDAGAGADGDRRQGEGGRAGKQGGDGEPGRMGQVHANAYPDGRRPLS